MLIIIMITFGWHYFIGFDKCLYQYPIGIIAKRITVHNLILIKSMISLFYIKI